MNQQVEINTHGMVCDFGKHKGTPYTRIPVNYLQWMVNDNHHMAHVAAAELARRGTVQPEMEISGHALDRASLSCWKIWREHSQKNEGLHAWLHRVAMEALESTEPDHSGKHNYLGMRFAFTSDGVWPVLKTVMRG